MKSNERIRVLVVDDHSIVREGLKYVLEQSGEFEVVGQAGDGEEAVRVAAEVSPDLVVMDVMMPRKDGVEACRDIVDSAPRDPCRHADGRERGNGGAGGGGRWRNRISSEGNRQGTASLDAARRVPGRASLARRGCAGRGRGGPRCLRGREMRPLPPG